MNKKNKSLNTNIYLILFFISLIILYSNLIAYFEFIFLIPLILYLKNKPNFEYLSITIFIASIINFSFFYEYGIKYIFIAGLLSTLVFIALSYIIKYSINQKIRILIIPSSFLIIFFLLGLTPVNNFWINLTGFLNSYPILIQYIGSSGILFIIILINTLIFELISSINNQSKNKKIKYFYLLLILILLSQFFLFQIKPNNNETKIEVMGIQANLNQSWVNRTLNKNENLNKYLSLTDKGLKKYNPKIVIWQEYLFTHAFEFDLEMQEKIKKYSNKNNITIVLGSITLENKSSLSSKRYNTLYVISKNNLQTYNAYEPFPLFDENYVKEEKNNPIIIENNSIGFSLCYEENHPYIFTTQVKENNAKVFFAIGNQYAMTNYHALKTTSLNSNIRATENNRYIFRLETSGLTTVIDNTGKNLKQIPINSEESLYYEIPLINEKTFYSKNKNLVEINLFIVSLLILLIGFYFKLYKSKIKKN